MYSGTTRAEKKRRRKEIRVIYFAVPDVGQVEILGRSA
jgi:hypothetical protein